MNIENIRIYLRAVTMREAIYGKENEYVNTCSVCMQSDYINKNLFTIVHKPDCKWYNMYITNWEETKEDSAILLDFILEMREKYNQGYCLQYKDENGDWRGTDLNLNSTHGLKIFMDNVLDEIEYKIDTDKRNERHFTAEDTKIKSIIDEAIRLRSVLRTGKRLKYKEGDEYIYSDCDVSQHFDFLKLCFNIENGTVYAVE